MRCNLLDLLARNVQNVALISTVAISSKTTCGVTVLDFFFPPFWCPVPVKRGPLLANCGSVPSQLRMACCIFSDQEARFFIYFYCFCCIVSSKLAWSHGPSSFCKVWYDKKKQKQATDVCVGVCVCRVRISVCVCVWCDILWVLPLAFLDDRVPFATRGWPSPWPLTHNTPTRPFPLLSYASLFYKPKVDQALCNTVAKAYCKYLWFCFPFIFFLFLLVRWRVFFKKVGSKT